MIRLSRPPQTDDELHAAVKAMFGVDIPRTQVCPDHVAPFTAFSHAFFARRPNTALWYGSRGCLAADTIITVNRATLGRRRPIGRFVGKYHGGGVGRQFDPGIPTYIQRAVGDHARLGLLGTAWDSGIKTTYEVRTASGRSLRATAEHPLLVDNQVFTPISDLSVGDEVAVNRGKSAKGAARVRYQRDVARLHPKSDRGLYWRHRLVAEARLNGLSYERYLDLVNTDPTGLVFLTDEHVHHLNHDPNDNRAENLVVLSELEHHRLHAELGATAHVLDQIGTDRIISVRRWGDEPTYDLTMADAPNNYIANDFVVHNSGKSYLLALLGLAKSTMHMCSTTILGGSIHQSNNVYQHMDKMMDWPNAPQALVQNFTKTELEFTNKTTVKPLSASATSVRGPHPTLHLLDEIDEMEWSIYQSSLGQAMRQPNALGVELNEYVVKSSTWQNVDGTFARVIAEHRERGLPIFSWCFRELLRPYGWMDPGFIERKKATVPAEMWRVEYELGEPSGATSVFDIPRLKEVFVRREELAEHSRHSFNDDLWIYEAPSPTGVYAMGVDLAKTTDWTVALVARLDVTPYRVVAIAKVGRIPWPNIIDKLKALKAFYGNTSMGHDGTGLGSVVTDLLEGYSTKFLFIGEQRKRLLNEMIANVENRAYSLPMSMSTVNANPLFDKLKATKAEDVWSTTLVNSHLPDETAALAVLNGIVEKSPYGVYGQSVSKGKEPPAHVLEMTQGLASPDDLETIEFEIYRDDPASRSVFVPSL